MFSNFQQCYQGMKDHSKITKMHFWMIQRARKRFLNIFWSLVCRIDLILHILIVLNVFQLSATLPLHEGSFKDDKNAFLNGPKSQKGGFLVTTHDLHDLHELDEGLRSLMTLTTLTTLMTLMTVMTLITLISIVQLFNYWRWAHCPAMLQFSKSVEVRLGIVGWSFGWSVCYFSGKPRTGFFWFFAWMFLTIRVRNAHGGFPGKNLDHSKIHDVRPKTAIFQLWADFDGNLAVQSLFLMV